MKNELIKTDITVFGGGSGIRDDLRFAVLRSICRQIICSRVGGAMKMEQFIPREGLPNLFYKLENEGEVTIVYLGGSITRAEGYRAMTANWLRQQYPEADIRAVNSGISGTGSDLGCARVETDVLRHKPDLVVVEFVVNDGGASESKAWIEGIVRQIRKRSHMTDVLFVYTLTERDVAGFQAGQYQQGALLQDELADYYGIPSIHLGIEVSRLVTEGSLVFTAKSDEEPVNGTIVFTHDSVHPTISDGHRIYASTIIRHLETVRGIGRSGGQVEHPFPLEPLVAENPWEYAVLLTPEGLAEFSSGWTYVTPENFELAREYEWLFPGLWRACEPGDAFTVEFTGTRIGLFDIGGPDSGRLRITVDGGEPFIVDRFTPHNDHNRNQYVFLPELSNGKHSVRFEIDTERTDKAGVFEAVGNQRSLEHLQQYPEWYNRTVIQLGRLLLVQPPL